MKLILASNNKKKIRELHDILSEMGIDVISQREAGCDFEVEETGTTFEENAFIKAQAVVQATGLAAIADDSGLVVDALDGAPGIYSARYTGTHEASDEERYEFLLKNMLDKDDRGAKFVCCICCLFPDGRRIDTRGECPGDILYAPRGEGGFGYDPIFRPEGFEVSMAELTNDEKNAISHRGKALTEFRNILKEYINATDK